MTLSRRTLLAAAAATPAVLSARLALALTPQQELIEKSRLTFEKLITSVEFGELPGYTRNAKGIMIYPELYKGGFILGAEGGRGILAMRQGQG